MKEERQYYSRRKGLDPQLIHPDLGLLKELFLALYRDFGDAGFFREAFGTYGEDTSRNWGLFGGRVGDVGRYFLRTLRKDGLWPIETHISNYSEEDLFDVIELLYDNVSEPTHTHLRGDLRAVLYDRHAAQGEYRGAVNGILRDYLPGYELSAGGEILLIGDPGLQGLLEAELVELDPTNVENRVNAATQKFRRRSSSLDDRRDAVKSLADVLEYLRPELKKVITKKDENTLFRLANEFGVRHHTVWQQTDYDQPVWLNWMFYFYLATIHAVTRLITKAQEANT